MKTLLERQTDVIRRGDTIDMVPLMAVMSTVQLSNFLLQLLGTPQTTLTQMATDELVRRSKEQS